MGIAKSYGGVPSLVDQKGDPRPGRTRTDISIGRYPVSPADLASVYATFAAGGTRAQRHFVQSVTGAGDEPWYTSSVTTGRVLDSQVAADVTTVLHNVAVHDGEPEGHPSAAKSGTQQWGNTTDNQDAWMAGYTPKLAAVVWLGKPTPGPIRDASGAPITGDGLPAQLWRQFMSDALRGQPAAALPAPAHLGRTNVGDAREAGDRKDKPASGNPASGPKLVDRTRSGGRSLALTFDDGPSEYTGAVLDALAKYHVKATFCLVGEQVAGNAATVGRIIAEGHELCDHSMRHDDLSTMKADKIKKDLQGTIAALRAVSADAKVNYFRAPFGAWGESPAVATALGMSPVTWTVDTGDWETPGVDAIVRTIHDQLKPGGIVLMHDGGGNRTQTAQALAIVIPQLLAGGWTFDLPASNATPIADQLAGWAGTHGPSTSVPAPPSASGSPSSSTGPSEPGPSRSGTSPPAPSHQTSPTKPTTRG
jgi:peptidoglycan/xylan/chitin deacetylase (PgdA/CDA1 family)